MNNHKKTKHPELLEGQPKRGRGRPRKYPPKAAGDFESTKYDSFFNNAPRCPEEGKTIDVKNVVNQVFDLIYKGSYMEKLFSHPKSFEENPILKNLVDDAIIDAQKAKNSKSCDEVFYEYLKSFKDKTNEKYFMEPNNFFDLDENDRNEIIEIIQHFCIWLFKNEYTKSKLSLAN